MGNKTQKQKNNIQFYKDNLHKYTVIQKGYGGLILKQIQTNKCFILNQYVCIEKNKYLALLKYSQFFHQNNFQHLANLVSIEKIQYGNICTSSYRLTLIYQYSIINLQNQIEARNKQNMRYFSEKDVLNIVKFLCNVIKQSKKQQLRIIPQRILIFEGGNLKLAQKNILLLNQNQSDLEYQTPQSFQNNIKQNIDIQLFFSIGMTMLSVLTLQDSLQCYDFRQRHFRYSVLQEKIQKSINLYSNKLIQLITDLLQTNDTQSLTLDDLELRINSFYSQKQSEFNMNNTVTCSQIQLSQRGRPIPLNFLSKPHKTIFQDKIYNMSSQIQYSGYNIDEDQKSQQIIQIKQRTIFAQIDNNITMKGSQIPSLSQNLLISNIRLQTQNLQTENNRTYQSIIFNLQNKKLKEKKIKKEKSLKYNIGKARIQYPNGSYYEGDFINHKMHGYGCYYYGANKLAYKGNWTQNKFNGRGVLYNENPRVLNKCFNYRDFNELQNYWSIYEGDFKMDSKSGKGRLFLTNGEYYEGEFKNDCIEGYGQFHRRNEVIGGRWVANQLL